MTGNLTFFIWKTLITNLIFWKMVRILFVLHTINFKYIIYLKYLIPTLNIHQNTKTENIKTENNSKMVISWIKYGTSIFQSIVWPVLNLRHTNTTLVLYESKDRYLDCIFPIHMVYFIIMHFYYLLYVIYDPVITTVTYNLVLGHRSSNIKLKISFFNLPYTFVS